MVSTQDAAKVLAIFRTKVVAAKPQLLKVFIELHGRHCTEQADEKMQNREDSGPDRDCPLLRMKVPFPERLFPCILSTCRAQLALTERSNRVIVCSSRPQ